MNILRQAAERYNTVVAEYHASRRATPELPTGDIIARIAAAAVAYEKTWNQLHYPRTWAEHRRSGGIL